MPVVYDVQCAFAVLLTVGLFKLLITKESLYGSVFARFCHDFVTARTADRCKLLIVNGSMYGTVTMRCVRTVLSLYKRTVHRTFRTSVRN